MIVARLRVQLLLPGCTSLKQKRFILNSLKARLRSRFNLALCETDFQDKWQRTELGFATVATTRRGVDRTIQAVVEFLERDGRVALIETDREYV